MENKLLKELYDCFYIRPELDEQENEVEKCHKALIAALEKPERKLVLRIIDAQDSIREQTSLDSFIWTQKRFLWMELMLRRVPT